MFNINMFLRIIFQFFQDWRRIFFRCNFSREVFTKGKIDWKTDWNITEL